VLQRLLRGRRYAGRCAAKIRFAWWAWRREGPREGRSGGAQQARGPRGTAEAHATPTSSRSSLEQPGAWLVAVQGGRGNSSEPIEPARLLLPSTRLPLHIPAELLELWGPQGRPPDHILQIGGPPDVNDNRPSGPSISLETPGQQP